MKTTSLNNTSSVDAIFSRSTLTLFGQWVGVFFAYMISMIVANIASPFPQAIMERVPAAGFLSNSVAMPFSAAVCATIFLWAARRASFKGFKLVGSLFVLSFLAQTFQTQIETAYFLSAFPLLHGNFEVYRLFLRGAIASIIFALLVTLIVGGFSSKSRPAARFTVHADRFIISCAWLGAVYFILYILFGYYIAWQSQTLRIFYGGPADLNSFADQILKTLMSKPEMPFFQYTRGILWIVCLVPLFKSFTGGRVELVILSALALGLLPTAQLAFANPLMPAEVSLYHFWEVSLSMYIFGALCACFVPTKVPSES